MNKRLTQKIIEMTGSRYFERNTLACTVCSGLTQIYGLEEKVPHTEGNEIFKPSSILSTYLSFQHVLLFCQKLYHKNGQIMQASSSCKKHLSF